MLLSARDASDVFPPSQVAGWVADVQVATKIGSFLATVIVYDSGEYFVISNACTDLILVSKLLQLTER